MHTVLALFFLTGCWSQWERQYDERWAEMADHQQDALTAVAAAKKGDLDAVNAAGEGLARKDKVPQLPPEVVPMLDAVRARGEAIAKAKDLGVAADELGALAAECRACHQSLKVETVGTDAAEPIQSGWLALVWHDEATWAKSGLAGETWDARRLAVIEALKPPPEPTPDVDPAVDGDPAEAGSEPSAPE